MRVQNRLSRAVTVAGVLIAFAAPACVDPSSNLLVPPPLPPIPGPPGPPGDPPPPPGASDISNRRFALPLALEDAERIVLETGMFGGRPHIAAYNRILDEPDAAARVLALVARAGPAGQLYLLGALLALDHPYAAELERRLLQSTDTVLQYHGGEEPSVRELALLIRKEARWHEWRRLKPIPVRLFLEGQPFTMTAGMGYTRDGFVDLEFVESDPIGSMSGFFGGDHILVAFSGGTGAGGVRRDSLSIEAGPGRLPADQPFWQKGCVAVWRGPAGRPKRFALTFRVTTDPGLACRSPVTK